MGGERDEAPALGIRLRRARLAARISQEELAERTGLSVRAIRDLERGHTRRPYPNTMRLLADALRTLNPAGDEAPEPGTPEPRGENQPPVPAPQPARDGPAVPRQLPASVRHFVGRSREQRTLSDLLDEASTAAGAMVICAVRGMAGVGKTALAVHWARQVADRFPDGQLYVNLRGFDPAGVPLAPATAVRRFLEALAVPPSHIPAEPEAQFDLYRSLLAGRRMLILLDNARDADQVRPLLPGNPGCLVVVTSRDQLTALVAAQDAHPVSLDLLTAQEARALLAQRLGTERVESQPAATAAIIDGCARLPLALAIVAARAATRPDQRLRDFADELADARAGLDTLTAGDTATDVRTVFSWSYHALSAPARRLFPLLGLHAGPDISAPAAASLAGIPPDRIRPVLAELTRAHLLAEHVRGRYTMHDLLRVYAADLAHTEATGTARSAALHRLLDHYRQTAYLADRLLAQALDPPTIPPPRPGVVAEPLRDQREALAWFIAEHVVLMTAADHALAAGFDTYTVHLAWILLNYLDRRGHWADLAEIAAAAVTAAERLADLPAQARAERAIGRAYGQLGRFGDAHDQMKRALDLYRRADDQTGQAHTHYNLAYLWGRQERPARALDHARQALELFQAAGHRFGQARTLNTIGWLHAQLGDYRQALGSCEQALALQEELDDALGLGGTWDSLGYAHQRLGHIAEARSCYRHAIDRFRDRGARYYEADTLVRLGEADLAAGETAAARDSWQQALAIFDDLAHSDAVTVRARLSELDRARRRRGPRVQRVGD